MTGSGSPSAPGHDPEDYDNPDDIVLGYAYVPEAKSRCAAVTDALRQAVANCPERAFQVMQECPEVCPKAA